MSQQINLYRPIFRRQEKKFSARAMSRAGAVMLAGVAVLYVVFAWQLHGLRAEARTIDTQYQDGVARLENITRRFGPQAPDSTLRDRVATLERQVALRRRMHEALQAQVFTDIRGYSDYLLAFARQDLPAVWLTAFMITGAGDEMMLQGRTADPVDVPRYVQRLASESALAGKAFQTFFLRRDQGRYADFLLSTKLEAGDGRSSGASRR